VAPSIVGGMDRNAKNRNAMDRNANNRKPTDRNMVSSSDGSTPSAAMTARVTGSLSNSAIVSSSRDMIMGDLVMGSRPSSSVKARP
jgi:hypothetical protein